MKVINELLRGVVIGVANIIPGVSGGTMMVSMGVYDTLIYCLTHLFSEFGKSIKTLLPYIIGMLVGIVALASVLTYCFDAYPLQTATTFIGLILGGLSPLLKKIDRKRVNFFAMLIFLAFFALIVVLAITNPTETTGGLTLSVGQVLMLVVMGIVASATMLIPGVSGSLVLMLLGYYQPVIQSVNDFKTALFAADMPAILHNVGILLPFGIGVLLGIYFVAKGIAFLIEHFPIYTYCGVLGLVVASPIAILLRTNLSSVNTVSILVSLVTFIAGFAIAAWLAKGSDTSLKSKS